MPNIYKEAVLGVPIGTVIPFTSDSVPKNWLLCDGSEVSRSEYSKLFEVIGTTYGSGDGSTTFNLPDLRTRVPVGKHGGDADFQNLAQTGGSKTHTLTVDEIPSHNHSISSDGAHKHSLYQEKTATATGKPLDVCDDDRTDCGWSDVFCNEAGAHDHGGAVGATGGGQAHNNLQPYIVLNYIIRAK